MKNRFFQFAYRRAMNSIGKPGRLLLLLTQLANKLRQVNWSEVTVNTAKQKILIMGRLVKAYATGQYRTIPWKSIVIVLAAVIYFLMPIDLIPDFIPLTGLTDDFAVLLWVYNATGAEIDKFLSWEKSKSELAA